MGSHFLENAVDDARARSSVLEASVRERCRESRELIESANETLDRADTRIRHSLRRLLRCDLDSAVAEVNQRAAPYTLKRNSTTSPSAMT